MQYFSEKQNRKDKKSHGNSIYFFKIVTRMIFVSQVFCTPLTRTKIYNFVIQKTMF